MSLAKQFEKNIASQMREIKDTYVYRLTDLVNQLGVSNPCDYFCFYKDTFFLLEMKTTATPSMPLKNISDYQFSSMMEASKKKGVKAFFLIWWYNKDVTRAVPVDVIADIKRKKGKSIKFNYEDNRIITIAGIKKKVYYEYDWKKFFKECKANGSKQADSTAGRSRRTSHRAYRTRHCKQANKRTRRIRCTH